MIFILFWLYSSNFCSSSRILGLENLNLLVFFLLVHFVNYLLLTFKLKREISSSYSHKLMSGPYFSSSFLILSLIKLVGSTTLLFTIGIYKLGITISEINSGK